MKVWMTRESFWRLMGGGNQKGAVPVHGKQSHAASVPFYDSAELEAAVLAERGRCAEVIESLAGPDVQEALIAAAKAIRVNACTSA